MPAARPSLAELKTRILGDISSRTEGAGFLKRSVEHVFGLVLAGAAHLLWGGIAHATRQIAPRTMDEDNLLRFGSMIELPRKGGGRAGGGALQFSGANGTVIPPGTHVRSPGGALLATTTAQTIALGVASSPMRALEPGAAANVELGQSCTLATSIAGLESAAVCTSAITGGTDLEPLERYRARVVSATRRTPRAGGPGDYVSWALEMEGVTRAWEHPARMGIGTVGVAFVFDDRDDIIPAGEDVSLMQNWLDERAPLDVHRIDVRAPIPKPVSMTLVLQPATIAVRDAVLVELAALFAEIGHEETLARSNLDEAISNAPGETAHSITTHTSLTPGPWEILTLGEVTTNVVEF